MNGMKSGLVVFYSESLPSCAHIISAASFRDIWVKNTLRCTRKTALLPGYLRKVEEKHLLDCRVSVIDSPRRISLKVFLAHIH